MNFCTLFNSDYLSRGLVTYESLINSEPNAHLFILAFDENCYNILIKLDLAKVTIITLKDFEDSELLEIKPTRSLAEYCWTCTPSIILYCIKKFNLSRCTYIDADLYFYSSPIVLIDEMDVNDVLITSHRFTPYYDQSNVVGYYCVQFMTFRNTNNGINILNWWRERCIEWCFAYPENGKLGDQKYLDDWSTRFKGIHELKHLGGGLAPWNIQQYKIFYDKLGLITLKEKNTNIEFKPIFYHYHGLRFYTNRKTSLCGYFLPNQIIKIFYNPYIERLNQTSNIIDKFGFDIPRNGSKK